MRPSGAARPGEPGDRPAGAGGVCLWPALPRPSCPTATPGSALRLYLTLSHPSSLQPTPTCPPLPPLSPQRRLYQRAIAVPTHLLELLWKQYEGFENQQVSRGRHKGGGGAFVCASALHRAPLGPS